MFKKELRGCVELSAFLKQGMTRFDNDHKLIMTSFMVPLLIAPIIAAFNITMPNNGDVSYFQELANVSIIWICSTLLFLGILYIIIGFINNRDNFSKFIKIYNWLSVPAFVLQLPFLLLATANKISWESASNYMLLQMLFIYAVLAFVIIHNFRVHFTISICLVIVDILCVGFIYNIIK